MDHQQHEPVFLSNSEYEELSILESLSILEARRDRQVDLSSDTVPPRNVTKTGRKKTPPRSRKRKTIGQSDDADDEEYTPKEAASIDQARRSLRQTRRARTSPGFFYDDSDTEKRISSHCEESDRMIAPSTDHSSDSIHEDETAIRKRNNDDKNTLTQSKWSNIKTGADGLSSFVSRDLNEASNNSQNLNLETENVRAIDDTSEGFSVRHTMRNSPINGSVGMSQLPSGEINC